MQEFLNNLYEIENFTTYISIAIAVLVILFFLVLFLGKKDQKLEETKKLQKIEMDAFKETSIPVKVEVNNDSVVSDQMPANVAENVMPVQNFNTPVVGNEEFNSDIIMNVPAINENPVTMQNDFINPVVVPEENQIAEDNTLLNLQDLTNGNVIIPIADKPVFEKPSFEMPILSEMSQDESSEPISLSELSSPEIELPKVKEEKFEEVIPREEIVLPEFNFDDVINSLSDEVSTEKVIENTPVFESPVLEDTFINEDISVPPLTSVEPELIVPELKVEEPYKQPLGQPIFSSVYAPKKEMDDFIDLTSISEEKKEEPNLSNVANNTSFNAILGETYDIK